MRFLALCTDYDGTVADHGKITPETCAGLARLAESGRMAVLVTGRQLDELLGICPEIDRFAYVVAENGAVLYEPSSRVVTLLATRPPDAFYQALRERNVDPVAYGRVIVATWEPHEKIVYETIRDLGLELQVIFNKGAVMVLPTGVNKATGLTHALKAMGISPHQTCGVGDAENDHALLGLCGAGVAVANALSTLKDVADFVTTKDHGAGVVELIDEILANDLARVPLTKTRPLVPLGVLDQVDGTP